MNSPVSRFDKKVGDSLTPADIPTEVFAEVKFDVTKEEITSVKKEEFNEKLSKLANYFSGEIERASTQEETFPITCYILSCDCLDYIFPKIKFTHFDCNFRKSSDWELYKLVLVNLSKDVLNSDKFVLLSFLILSGYSKYGRTGYMYNWRKDIRDTIIAMYKSFCEGLTLAEAEVKFREMIVPYAKKYIYEPEFLEENYYVKYFNDIICSYKIYGETK